MRKKLNISEAIFPMPVLLVATYNEDGSTNTMTAAWGTMVDRDIISLQLEDTHKTVENIKSRGAFTVNIADAAHMAEADYLGIVSGHDEPEKVAKAGLHVVKSEFVDAPIIEEFPLTLECRFVSFDSESERLIGQVVNVSIEERIIGEKGTPDLSKFHPFAYDPANHTYVALGDKIGDAYEEGLKLK